MWINCRKCGQLMDDCFTIPDCVCFDCWDEAEANGELYYCSDCGQVSVLPLKNDKCEECSSRSASSGKKKKPKIQKAAALIMAMMIALSCLTFSVFAEDDTFDVFDTTYKGYTVFQCTTNSSIRLDTLYNFHKNNYSEYRQLILYLIYFDENGNIHYYCNHPNASYLDYCTLYDVDETSSSACVYNLGFLSGNYYVGTSLDSGCLGSNNTTFHFGQVYGMEYPHIFRSFDNGVNLMSGGSPYHDSSSTNFPLFDDNTTYYFIPVPYDNANGLNDAYYRNLLIDNGSQSDLVTKVAPTYTAKFHSFASMNDGDVILNMLDWIGAGKQYPIADFSINDNGQYHDYSLRISLNKNYVDVCMGLWEDWRNNLISSALPGGLGCLLTGIKSGSTTDIVNGAIQLKFFGKFPLSVMTVPTESGTAAAIRKLSQYNMIKSLDNLSYVTQYNLTDSHLNFAEGESSVRAYSVCLADYVTIVKGLLYRLDIVDNNTGMILDTAYFCNDSTYAKTNTGYGTKVYNYDSADDLNNDIENDNGYISNSGKVETDKMQTDNNTDIVVNFDPNELDLGSYMDSLNGIVSDVSSFFTWVWQLFPPEIMTIIIIGVGLLVTCGLVKFFVG